MNNNSYIFFALYNIYIFKNIPVLYNNFQTNEIKQLINKIKEKK